MKTYNITIGGKNIKVVQNEDGTFIKPDIVEELLKFGTAIKPAHEPICMARKPLGYWETKNTLTAKEKDEFQDLWDKMEAGMPYDEKRYEELWAKKEVKVFKSLSVAENCLKYGTGGINIDESRVGTDKITINGGGGGEGTGWGKKEEINEERTGRFPANIIHDNSEEVRECFPDSKSSDAVRKNNGKLDDKTFGKYNAVDSFGFNDSGNASRFFKSIIYQAKASKSERNKGMDNLEAKPMYKADGSAQSLEIFGSTDGGREYRKNNHPTVKPIALMEYLIKMVTPKGGIVLDPFAGSGTTLVAAKQNGYQYIGIELTEEYIPIIEARLNTLNQDKLL